MYDCIQIQIFIAGSTDVIWFAKVKLKVLKRVIE
jgi:hypothetical protein